MGHTILVIDGQWSTQEFARIVLRTAGYRVLLAGDLVTGLSLARTEQPDVTIFDVNLASPDVSSFLRHLREDAKTVAMPVLLISSVPEQGEREPEDSERLYKPFQPPELLRKVDHLLHRHELPITV